MELHKTFCIDPFTILWCHRIAIKVQELLTAGLDEIINTSEDTGGVTCNTHENCTKPV